MTDKCFVLFDLKTTTVLSNFTISYNNNKKYAIVDKTTPAEIATATNFCNDLFIFLNVYFF